MKKNLRIVSAAAAALLAVAPVAATVVPAASTTVSAEVKGSIAKGDTLTVTKELTHANANIMHGSSAWEKIPAGATLTVVSAGSKKTTVKYGTATLTLDTSALMKNSNKNAKPSTPADTASENITNNFVNSSMFDNDPNMAVNISAVAGVGIHDQHIPFGNVLNGNVVYTDAKGAQHTAMLHGDSNTTLYKVVNNKLVAFTSNDRLTAGQPYVAAFKKVTINLGNAAAGTTVKFILPKNAYFANPTDKNYVNVKSVKVDANGIADLGEVYAQFYAYDPTDLQEAHFYSVKTGNVVTSGNVTLHAVNGQLNIASLLASMTREYVASQLDGDNVVETLAPQNDLRDQLEKQNIKVDANGYFTAPASFSVNLNAKSNINGATVSLPVAVTVDNATASNTNTNETTKNVTIMHISTIYDKNGKATHDAALRAYNSVSVVSDPVTLKDENGKDAGKFYKLAGQDRYIKVGNVDGTSRSLKHNSYVYKSTGKRANKKTLKSGSSVTTYGKSFMIAGHQMYRIGKNQYVKKANF